MDYINMELQTVSKELAILLKKLGFDLETLDFYLDNGYKTIHSTTVDHWDRPFYDGNLSIDEHFSDWNNNQEKEDRFSAPSLEQVRLWFIKKHNIIVCVDCACENDWWYQLKHSPNVKTKVYVMTSLHGEYMYYENALNKGLLEACKLLTNLTKKT